MTHARAREPFSVRVSSDAWIADSDEWIHACLERSGVEALGPVTTQRIRAWSMQRSVPTTAGTIWFKANCEAMGFEPSLQMTLARVAPGSVEEPLAIDEQRQWMLTRDHGGSLGDRGESTTAQWQAALQEAASLQRTLVDHRDDLLATGLPDCSPATVPVRFDLLLDELELDVGTAARLASRRPEIVNACAALEESVLPTSWQHGDLHPWNLHGSAGAPRLFDFGDSQWAHVAEVLMVPFGLCAENPDLDWDDLVDPWREVWGVDRTTFDIAWNAAHFTHPVNRALTWHRSLVTATEAELDQWGEAPGQHLVRILDA